MTTRHKHPVPEVGLKAAKRAAQEKKQEKKQGILQDKPLNQIVNQTTKDKIMTATKPNFEKLTSDAAASGKEHMDAFVKTGTLLTKGSEELVKTCIGLVQNSTEKSAEAVKALMACKTLNELTETQNKLVQDSFETYMSGVTKLSELTVKLANTSFEPMNTQFTRTMKKVADQVAA